MLGKSALLVLLAEKQVDEKINLVKELFKGEVTFYPHRDDECKREDNVSGRND